MRRMQDPVALVRLHHAAGHAPRRPATGTGLAVSREPVQHLYPAVAEDFTNVTLAEPWEAVRQRDLTVHPLLDRV